MRCTIRTKAHNLYGFSIVQMSADRPRKLNHTNKTTVNLATNSKFVSVDRRVVSVKFAYKRICLF